MLDGWLKLEAEAGRQAVRLRLGLRLERGLCLGLGQRAPLQSWDFWGLCKVWPGLGLRFGLGSSWNEAEAKG